MHFVDCLYVFVDGLELVHFTSRVASLPFRLLLSKRRAEQPGCRKFIGEYPISLGKPGKIFFVQLSWPLCRILEVLVD